MGHHKKKKKHHKKHHKKSSSDSSDLSKECSKKSKLIGPSLPVHNFPITSNPLSIGPSSSSDSYGPQLPPHLTQPKPIEAPLGQFDDSNDEDVIGPLPSDQPSSSQHALNERAEILKYEFLIQNNTPTDTAPVRETWMTELPPEKANIIGLGPRKFRTSANTADPKNRALWTETPQNKKPENAEEETDTYETMVVHQRNKLMDEMVEKIKDKREKKSLLEIHRANRKKKELQKKEEKAERRPFDRDADLQVNRFDEAQKKSILKKAQLLDTRFSAGRSKYL